MEKPPSINIGTAASPITAVFGEANPEQRLACSKLGATAFLPPLTPAQYLQREEFMSTLPLTKGTGWRFWCLFNKDRPNQVFSTCRTIDRDLLVRDAQGETRRERGYCISSVVSDDEYRERGLASFLLGKVTEWMDGPGQAFASFLYTSNRSAVCDSSPRSYFMDFESDVSLLSLSSMPPEDGTSHHQSSPLSSCATKHCCPNITFSKHGF